MRGPGWGEGRACYDTAPQAVACLRFPASVPVSPSSPGTPCRERAFPSQGPESCLGEPERCLQKGC